MSKLQPCGHPETDCNRYTWPPGKTIGTDFCRMCSMESIIRDLRASNIRLERALRYLHSEVDCRIEHGAESGGHLEYVRKYLKKRLDGLSLNA